MAEERAVLSLMNEGTACQAFWAVLRARRSVRRYTAEPVPQAVLTRLLDAACQAPSAHNSQPWRFVVVRDAAIRQHLAEAIGRRFLNDLQRDGLSADAAVQQVERSRQRITTAPVLVAVCLTTEDMDTYPDPARQALERQMGIQSVAAAIQTLLLAATAEGLAGCWLCAPIFCPDVVLETLDLPRHWQPQAFITLGYPAQPPKPKTRAPLSTRVVYR